MKTIIMLFASFLLASCEFEKADYNEYRFGKNVDFGEDVGNSSGSSFGFGSSYKSSSRTSNKRIYMGDMGDAQGGDKKDYSRFYRGLNDE